MSFMPIAVFHAELVCLGPLRCALALANAPVLHLLFLKLLLVSRPVGWELSGQVCTVRSQRIVSEEVRKNVKKNGAFGNNLASPWHGATPKWKKYSILDPSPHGALLPPPQGWRLGPGHQVQQKCAMVSQFILVTLQVQTFGSAISH